MQTNSVKKSKNYYAYNIELAGWIMACGKQPQLMKVEFYVKDDKTCFYGEFKDTEDSECDIREFLKLRSGQPEMLKQKVAAGLAQLTCYVNQLLKEGRQCSALNTKHEAVHG